jgi:hypothetical protein
LSDIDGELQGQSPIAKSLRTLHLNRTHEPIKGADQDGSFLPSVLREVPPIVLDACVLRDDILHSCSRGRTVLINAANERFLRLFVARHVLEEVERHGERWAADAGVSHNAFLERWRSEYLPLIHLVSVPCDALGLLTPAEAARISRLMVEDASDVPSAVLSLLLGGLFLSVNGHALRAVYGVDVDMDEHRQWLGALAAGADSGELEFMAHSSVVSMAIVGGGLDAGLRRLLRAPGPVLLGAGAAAGLLLIVGTSAVTKEGVKSAITTAAKAFGEGARLYAEGSAHFEAFVPPMPSWPEIAEAHEPLAVLARACVYTLARAKLGNHSAVEVADLIPSLPVAQGPAKVRQVLRSQPCFEEIHRGRWQVGVSVERTSPRQ